MTLKPVNLKTIINQKGTSLQTSEKHTEDGYAMVLSGEQQRQSVARLLEIADPHQVDKRLLTSVESTLGYKITEVSRTLFKDNQADIVVTGYRIESDSPDKVAEAITKVKMSLVPLPMEQLLDQLALLATLVVKPSGESPEDLTLRMRALANQMSGYPADIVSRAIKNVSETQTFWPAYAEFHKHITWKLRRRELLLEALNKKYVELTA